MSLVVENESVLPITVSEQDFIAVGVKEGTIPSLEAYSKVQEVQEEFCRSLDWSGKAQDVEKVIQDSERSQAIVVIIHKIPRFAACSSTELSDRWKNCKPLTRTTTLTSKKGLIDYIREDAEDGKGIDKWTRMTAWCGQTVFTFPAESTEEVSPKVPASPQGGAALQLLLCQTNQRART
jgi:hypothetical protein